MQVLWRAINWYSFHGQPNLELLYYTGHLHSNQEVSEYALKHLIDSILPRAANCWPYFLKSYSHSAKILTMYSTNQRMVRVRMCYWHWYNLCTNVGGSLHWYGMRTIYCTHLVVDCAVLSWKPVIASLLTEKSNLKPTETRKVADAAASISSLEDVWLSEFTFFTWKSMGRW